MTGFDQNLTNLINTLNQINLAVAALNKTISTVFPQALGTTTSATGGSATLPSQPAGFVSVVNPNNGDTIKIPYYT